MIRRLQRDDGQVLPLLVLGLLAVLLGFAALAVDVGRAYLVKRQLQSTADAVALAASDALPTVGAATTAATQFGPAGKNPVAGVDVTQTVTPWCLRSVSYCFGDNPGTAPTRGQATGVVVTETASVPTMFAKLFGLDAFHVSAKSTACGLCAPQPLDIALVVDRTGSMADDMTDLRNGLKSFLAMLDPSLDYVTLLVLPPAGSSGTCATPSPNYVYPDSTYTLVRMSHDYLNANGTLNTGSQLVSAVNCIQAGGATHYKEALVQAQDELVNHGSGRPNVRRVIVFESDGAANTVPASYLSGANLAPAAGHDDDVLRPCGSALDYANTVLKPSGTLVYTVAYALNLDDDCYQAPHGVQDAKGKWTVVNYRQIREATSASATLSAMASPGGAVTQATQGDMSTSFRQIATKLMSAKLVPDSEGP